VSRWLFESQPSANRGLGAALCVTIAALGVAPWDQITVLMSALNGCLVWVSPVMQWLHGAPVSHAPCSSVQPGNSCLVNRVARRHQGDAAASAASCRASTLLQVSIGDIIVHAGCCGDPWCLVPSAVQLHPISRSGQHAVGSRAAKIWQACRSLQVDGLVINWMRGVSGRA